MLKYKSLLMFCIIALWVSACSKPQENAIDFGSFDSGTYSNKYFNLHVQIPESWSVMDDETRIELMKQGAEVIAGDDKDMKAMFDASDLANVNMLTASRHPLGSPVPSNPTFMVIAEKIKHVPGIKRGSDYHFHTKKAMEASQVKVTFPREVYEDNVSGIPFDVLEMELDMGVKVYQNQYAVITKGYAVLIALTYLDPSELDELKSILHTVTMDI